MLISDGLRGTLAGNLNYANPGGATRRGYRRAEDAKKPLFDEEIATFSRLVRVRNVYYINSVH